MSMESETWQQLASSMLFGVDVQGMYKNGEI